MDLIPSNAQSNRWHAVIGGLKEIEYKLLDFTMPNLSNGVTEIPFSGPIALYQPGTRLSVDDLILNFQVDALWRNYLLCSLWLKANVGKDVPIVKDIEINLLDNQNQFTGTRVIYKDCFPFMIGPGLLDAQGAANDVNANVSFKCTDVEFQSGINADLFEMFGIDR
ncbi:gp3 tail completion and sheath stabilizer protein [Delftia phage PhiW-14]|uniref:Gp3 tail completion and sheath stabilizer protein n=1 Tax=Delftia phage PhiW-14 TaxID=665032 RepID=C9DG05_BPW14|nr:gp3 tail completion and sheath stabilizer protein [Delftia phage PhiW-14]ACV50056.1 gp3 tail completion and sheath stabilizer protein [Delftia phage PhiW-14]